MVCLLRSELRCAREKQTKNKRKERQSEVAFAYYWKFDDTERHATVLTYVVIMSTTTM